MKQKQVPLRRCISCGGYFPKKELIRVVRSPEEEVALDEGGKASGRGAYLCLNAECRLRAFKKGGLARALHTGLTQEALERISAEVEQAADTRLPAQSEGEA